MQVSFSATESTVMSIKRRGIIEGRRYIQVGELVVYEMISSNQLDEYVWSLKERSELMLEQGRS